MKKNPDAELSHWSREGKLKMIDVTTKKVTIRSATAAGKIRLKAETIKLIQSRKTPKGDVFTTAQIAGINAVKQNQFLIPMCHNLNITHCRIDFKIRGVEIEVRTTVKTRNRTGVEMEAMTGTALALLTIYDMLKPVDKSMVISEIKLMAKTGGKSGNWRRR